MTRAVADTNVYISAILFGGKPEEIRRLAKVGIIELLISEHILAEIAGVLKRKFLWPDWQISESIGEIRGFTTLVTPAMTLSVIEADDPDNRVLECALEVKAAYIVSGDARHIQPMKQFRGIKIMSPAQFLKLHTPRHPSSD